MSEHTTIITKETDATQEIRAAKINGTDYKWDYDGLKNRPCFREESLGDWMLESQSLSFVQRGICYEAEINDFTESFVKGDTYLVTWDGTEYKRKGFDDGHGGIMIGNLAIYDAGSDTGEPFLVYRRSNFPFYIYTNSDAASHTVAIRHVDVRTRLLDPELLPEGLRFAAETVTTIIPETTAEFETPGNVI